MDDSHALHDGILVVPRPLDRFSNVVDNVQEWEDEVAYAFLGDPVPFVLDPAAIVVEVRQGAQVALTLIAQILAQLFIFLRQITRRQQVLGIVPSQGFPHPSSSWLKRCAPRISPAEEDASTETNDLSANSQPIMS